METKKTMPEHCAIKESSINLAIESARALFIQFRATSPLRLGTSIIDGPDTDLLFSVARAPAIYTQLGSREPLPRGTPLRYTGGRRAAAASPPTSRIYGIQSRISRPFIIPSAAAAAAAAATAAPNASAGFIVARELYERVGYRLICIAARARHSSLALGDFVVVFAAEAVVESDDEVGLAEN